MMEKEGKEEKILKEDKTPLSINDDMEEDDEDVDAIQDEDDNMDEPQFGAQDAKNKNQDENVMYLEQVDDTHQILDGDEPMDMDQSNSQKRLMKIAMNKRNMSNLTNDVVQ